MRLCLSISRCTLIPTREEESVLWLGWLKQYYREILTCQKRTVSGELINLFFTP